MVVNGTFNSFNEFIRIHDGDSRLKRVHILKKTIPYMNLKKISLFAAMFFFVVSMQAQDAASLLKSAGKALSAYNLDQNGNADKLIEAKDAVDMAFKGNDFDSDFKAQLTRAKINTELMAKDYIDLNVKGSTEPQYAAAGPEALSALTTALSLAEKKFQTKEVLKVLGELTPYLSSLGNFFIGAQQYDKAYGPLNAVLSANKMLTDSGEKSAFETPEDVENHKYVTAVCAARADETDAAKAILTELYEAGTKEPGVYSQLYTMTIDEDPEHAMTVLRKGQELDPGNVDLLFAEINYYIKNQQFDKLEEKLKVAIEKDPENPSVRSALGNVYMNLSEKALEEDNADDYKKYFDSALDYYNQTLDLDPKSFDATYSIGSLYFNKAAALTQEMKDLGLSKEDQKRYTELEGETADLFAQAFPFFKKAEMLNPSDGNTIIALKEIFARQDNFDASNEFKKRLETVQAGGTIEKSYFE